jgi:hypothetical protein
MCRSPRGDGATPSGPRRTTRRRVERPSPPGPTGSQRGRRPTVIRSRGGSSFCEPKKQPAAARAPVAHARSRPETPSPDPVRPGPELPSRSPEALPERRRTARRREPAEARPATRPRLARRAQAPRREQLEQGPTSARLATPANEDARPSAARQRAPAEPERDRRWAQEVPTGQAGRAGASAGRRTPARLQSHARPGRRTAVGGRRGHSARLFRRPPLPRRSRPCARGSTRGGAT